METIIEAIIALMAAFGMMCLFREIFCRMGRTGEKHGVVYAVVPSDGDAGHLEGQIKQLLWLKGCCRMSVIIADRGLNPIGRAAASALLTQNPGLVICPADRLGEYIGHL